MDRHILINGIVKSATFYLSRTMRGFLDCERVHIATHGVTESRADPAAISKFLALPVGVAQEHIAPNDFNMSVLRTMGLTKFVLTLRDPRDVVVSWAHHMRRPDLDDWHLALVIANEIVPDNYYQLSWNEQLDVLIERGFPRFQNWIIEWLERLDHPTFDIHVVNYVRFAQNPKHVAREILTFFGYVLEEDAINLPDINYENREAGIDVNTNFRRGVAGGFLTELTDTQIKRIEGMLDHELYQRMGWPI